MTKDVLIRISGVHLMDDDNEDVEVITAGDYYKKNGKHYILYDEVIEGLNGIIKNIIKVTPDGMDITKRGAANVHMSFEKNKHQQTCYATPFGEMMVDISTRQIKVEEREDRLMVEVGYRLDINYEQVSECRILMDVCSREKADFRLTS